MTIAFRFFLTCALTYAHCAYAGFDLGREAGDVDLTSFVTRPEIKVPRLNITEHHPDAVVPGYIFVAPYSHLEQPSQPPKYYQACQSGPAIYDRHGELLWSGACYFKNQNAYDFRAFHVNGSDYLSLILFAWPHIQDYKGHGVIMDASFAPIDEVFAPILMPAFNMHEFNIINGTHALHMGGRGVLKDLTGLKRDYGFEVGLIADLGFREVDLLSKDVVFEWWASDHISVDDSNAKVSKLNGPYPTGWNWIHLNSIDKNGEGDYMISARYTDAIYKISGKDGSIIWTLGGRSSSFRLESFNFSRQHDARFISQGETSETITFLDNAGDEHGTTAHLSSALVVHLDKATMTARVIQRWTRPDGRVSRLRGNFQLLENGNAFTGWSDNGIISEHSSGGELLMSASFASDRFVTYRTYKANLTSTPSESPVLVARVYGPDICTSVSAFYVSWNGATEVARWSFFCVTGSGEEHLIGTSPRQGFETLFQTAGYHRAVFARALSGDGTVLGTTAVQESEVIGQWAQIQDGNAQNHVRPCLGILKRALNSLDDDECYIEKTEL